MEDFSFNIGNDEENESGEEVGLGKMSAYIGGLFRALLRVGWIGIVIGFFAMIAAGYLFYKYMKSSPERFETQTSLLYTPTVKQTGNVPNLRILVELFSRKSVYVRMAKLIGRDSLEEVEGYRKSRFKFELRKNQNNVIWIRAYSPSENQCISECNAFAQACIEEYSNYITEDLKIKLNGLQAHRKEIIDGLTDGEVRLQKMISPTSFLGPVEDLERVQTIITAQLNNLGTLTSRKTELDASYFSVSNALALIDTNALKNSDQIKNYQNKLSDLDLSIAKLEQLYTELNPKLKMVLNERTALTEQFNEFKKKNNIKDFDPELIGQASELSNEKNQLERQQREVNQQLEALSNELRKNQNLARTLSQTVAEFNAVNRQQQSMQTTLTQLDSEILTVESAVATASGDIQVVDESRTALCIKSFGVKGVAISLFAGVFFGGGSALLCTLFVLLFGRVHSAEDIALFAEMECLMVFPDAASRQKLNMAERYRTVYHELDAFPRPTVFLNLTLPGGDSLAEFLNELHNVAISNGRRAFMLELTTFDASEESDSEFGSMMLAIRRKGSSGKFVMTLADSFQVTELALINEDLKQLKTEFDEIVILRRIPVKGDELFIRQLDGIVNCVVFGCGWRRTKQQDLRRLAGCMKNLEFHTKVVLSGKPVA